MVLKMTKLIIRADGNSQMGLGHVIRSLALAQMLNDHFECIFMVRNPLPSLQEQILDICNDLIILPNCSDDLDEAKQIANTYLTGNEIVVLDGYHFITKYQQTIKDTGCKVVCIDDIHAYHFVADVVINHAPSATQKHYSTDKETKMLLGLDYALLRPVFHKIASQGCDQDKSAIQRQGIFICLGGSDHQNITSPLIRYVSEVKEIERVNVVVGAANQYKSEILNESKKDKRIIVQENLSSEKMAELMARSSIAIVPASTISLEAIACGCKIICGFYVDNQLEYYQYYEQSHEVTTIGDFRHINNTIVKEKLKKSLNSQNKVSNLIDGRAPERLLEQMIALLPLHVRRARQEDVDLLFRWENECRVKQCAYDNKKVQFSDYKKRFKQSLNSSETNIFIATVNDLPLAQIRFYKIDKDHYRIDYSIDKHYHSLGISTKVLQLGMKHLQKKANHHLSFRAFVKKENTSFAEVFKNLHFEENDDKERKGNPCYIFEKEVNYEE